MNIDLKKFFLENCLLRKDDKLVFLLLMSGAFKGDGLFYAPIQDISRITGVGVGSVKNALYSLSTNEKILSYDFLNEVCWLYQNDIHLDYSDHQILLKSELLSFVEKQLSLDKLNFDYLSKAEDLTVKTFQALIETQTKQKRKVGRPKKTDTPLVKTSKPVSIKQNQNIGSKEDKEDSLVIKNKKETTLALNQAVVDIKMDAPVPKEDKEEIITDYFNKFWKNYPRKNGKSDALKAFKSLLSKKSLTHVSQLAEDLINASASYKNECELKATEKQFIKLPATWIRKKSWEDFLDKETDNTPITENEKMVLLQYHNEFINLYPKKESVKETKMAFFSIKDKLLNEKGFFENLITKTELYLKNTNNNEMYLPFPSKWIKSLAWETYTDPLNTNNNGLNATMLNNNFQDYEFQSTVSEDFQTF